ncbi:MAG: single-stranded DNA-binding protein [Bdellovibrionales bacterium]|nr:single-stranded DNA-binding protein [Bdellovibrionales bacterium]
MNSMRDVNKVLLIGRLGADPTCKETPTGVALTRFSVATSIRRKESEEGKDEKSNKESTVWHRVVAWGREGEVCARYLKKGAAVFVEGRIRSNRYVNKDGQKCSDWEIHADRVSFLPSSGITQWPDRNPLNEEESVLL